MLTFICTLSGTLDGLHTKGCHGDDMEAIYAEKTLVRQKPPLHPPHTTVYLSKTLGALHPIFWSLVEDHPRSGRYQTVPLMSFVHV
jgi:hypothetical protein